MLSSWLRGVKKNSYDRLGNRSIRLFIYIATLPKHHLELAFLENVGKTGVAHGVEFNKSINSPCGEEI